MQGRGEHAMALGLLPLSHTLHSVMAGVESIRKLFSLAPKFIHWDFVEIFFRNPEIQSK